MKWHFFLLIAFTWSSAISGRLPAATPGDADAEFLEVNHEYILEPDGSVTYHYEHRLRLLTSYAFTRFYGESFVIYHPRWQTLKIRISETTMADGGKVESPFNAFNEVLPGFCANAAPYVDMREMVVTHTGLERDAVVHFAYSLKTKPGMYPGLMGRVLFGDRSPIRKLTVRIMYPGDRKLRYSLTGSDLKPIEGSATPTGSGVPYKTLTWTMENIPLVPVEDSQPPLHELVPALHFTTSTHGDLIHHILAGGDALFTLGKDADALVSKLTAGSQSETDKIERIREFISREVGYMSGGLASIGCVPRPAQETFRDNVGSALDRVILLAAMLRSAGFTASPVLLMDYTEEKLAPSAWPGNAGAGNSMPELRDVASIHLYENPAVICRLSGDDRSILLDPNRSQTGMYWHELSGRPYIRIEKNAPEPIGIVQPVTGTVTATSDWILGVNREVAGRSRIEVAGYTNPTFNRSAWSSSLARSFGKAGQGMTISEKEVEVSGGESAACGFKVVSSNPLSEEHGMVVFDLPDLPGGLDALHLSPSRAPRSTPIDLPGSFSESNLLTLHLPKGTGLASHPPVQRISNDVGSVECVIKDDGDDIEVIRTITLKPGRVTPDRHQQLMALVSVWDDPVYRRLYLAARSD